MQLTMTLHNLKGQGRIWTLLSRVCCSPICLNIFYLIKITLYAVQCTGLLFLGCYQCHVHHHHHNTLRKSGGRMGGGTKTKVTAADMSRAQQLNTIRSSSIIRSSSSSLLLPLLLTIIINITFGNQITNSDKFPKSQNILQPA